MKRLAYLNWTVAMLAVAYLLLRLIVIRAGDTYQAFPDGWQFLDPFRLIARGRDHGVMSIAVHVLLTAGLVLTSTRRARDAGWRPWLGFLMLIPVVRLFLFAVLAIVPSKRHTQVLDLQRTGWLGRIIPQSKGGNVAASILITLALIIPLGIINVQLLQEYGLALFIGLPFALGSLSAYLYNYHQRRSIGGSLGVAMLSTTAALFVLFILAMEGFLCLLMAAPIAYAIALVGALIGHAISNDSARPEPQMTMLLLLVPGLMAFEFAAPSEQPLFKVVTSIRVNAPAQDVWNELVAFSRMAEPDELLFRAGISYPVEARIVGTGVGACRFCQFNTGPFVEPITVWDEPHLLAFDVADDPPPMTELSIYDHVQAPHVDGFFRSHNGQFRLEEGPDGSTLLEGTTWYTHDIWPTWYWRFWSDAILHRIHARVLDHIKSESEAGR
jgi:hypothetical protein